MHDVLLDRFDGATHASTIVPQGTLRRLISRLSSSSLIPQDCTNEPAPISSRQSCPWMSPRSRLRSSSSAEKVVGS
jgi:hypothetical protein